MKLGIYGAGMIVRDFLSMYRQVEGLQLAYICATSPEEEVLQELCKEHAIPKYYTDVPLALADDTADTCYIGVPNHLHFEFCKNALLAGKNVICEKPFTTTYDEAKYLADLAKEKGKIIQEAVSTYYLPNAINIKDSIPALGDLKLVVLNFSSYSSRYDRFKSGEILPAFDCKKAGGALMDLNIYNISFVVYLFGEPRDVEYFANIEKSIDTSGVLVLDYETFKAVLIAAKDCKAPITGSIQGDKKCLLIKGPVNILEGYKVLNATGRGLLEDDGIYENIQEKDKHRMYYEFNEFVRIINNNETEVAQTMLDLSLITMKVQTQARKKADIVFPTD
ncbi:Gfo/Idh/MocA family oxidoreductase [Amedibacillus dolichus]|uniref:Gfo/Idh/MocA family oxidoreductase n=1 Tax=Amedibacillus dolichus TaxID=31971 RepID=A0ABT7UBX1_9FIRM|nr:Gfo/Idh/MocA family oxidoreductase [Amedibacillus dolichus]MDM8157124.1 Gfo/Idh/MocA family oxidoreductase [Amedibacillus dolichus]